MKTARSIPPVRACGLAALLAAVAVCLACAGCGGVKAKYGSSTWKDGVVTYDFPGYPDGAWSASVEGFSPEMRPGDEIAWTVRFSMDGEGI
ncbi:secreted protein, partial [sediment metagenome]